MLKTRVRKWRKIGEIQAKIREKSKKGTKNMKILVRKWRKIIRSMGGANFS